MRGIRPLLYVVVLSLFAGPVFAQGGGPEAASQEAYGIFLTGDYGKAVEAYEKLLADYPTAGTVPGARLQLAYAYFFLGDFDKSLEMLDKLLTGATPPAQIAEAARLLQPQVLSARATSLAPGSNERATGYKQAAEKFSAFLKDFPSSAEVPTALYGRALANFQIEKYDDAIPDLETSLSRFPKDPNIANSQNLLALALATKGSIELNKGADANREEALALYDRSIKILQEIIDSRVDLTLVNDAYFQLGEILFNQAAFSDEDKRKDIYQRALLSYRSILPQAEVVALQRARVEAFPSRRREAIQRNDRAALEALDKENERALRRLAELQAKDDQTTLAMLKMAEIFFNSNQPNASRVLINHLSPFLKKDEQKKRAQYFKTLTYATQGAIDRAVEAYEAFQSEFKGDPIAENLPFVMGNMFLNSADPAGAEKALVYFQESIDIYPKGRLAQLSAVSKASAESRLGKSEQSLETFRKVLAGNPRPEEAVIAQMGIANILRDTAKWDDAIAAYQEVIDKYPNQPAAIDAEFWIAFATQSKGDAAGVEKVQQFIKDHPESNLIPRALYMLASSQLASANKDAGLATLAELAEKYPNSEPAPFTYFQRAQILSAQGKKEEMLGLMKEFIEKYPQDDKVFFAYDTLAQTMLVDDNAEEALKAYRTFSTDYPESAHAPTAILKIADIQRAKAAVLGRYSAMPEADRATWKTEIEGSIEASESLIAKYPDNPQVATALRGLLEAQRLLVSAGIKKPDEIETYLQSLADGAATPGAKSKTLFTLATYVSESDPDRALEIMGDAYDPEFRFTAPDLDSYGLALIGKGRFDDAAPVYDKILADYQIPAGTPQEQVAPDIQEAQAIALFGKGRIAQEQGNTVEAAKFFEQLKTLYPWSPKVLEANYGIAQSFREEKKYDEALGLLAQIIRSTTAPAELRAKAMFLGGEIMEEKGDTEAAIDYFSKIFQFYSGVPSVALQGLWRAGQLLEKQAATLTDAAKKKRQLDLARRAYQDIVNDFPNSELAPKAQERLTALGK